ncbi:class I SAM-dependent methyltransferase [Synechococcus sp. CBW1004]|uniref:class I SAM-dependent methyltransferase n=1 Tax=Synechococcus sp. CBW1004 TaxID=1353136 RepID=UPI001E4A750E|nr:class I SAM-dependent methyltransferase [Synechococcus sp. CBW1004]
MSKAAFSGAVAIDLGCGRKKTPGTIGIDRTSFEQTDIVTDLESQPLPFKDDYVDLIWADQVIEHINNFIPLMKEIHRVLKPGGQFIAKTPYFRSAYSVVDPTHVRQFSIMSMDYYVHSKYLFDQYRFFEPGFTSLKVKLDSDRGLLTNFISELVSRRAIANPRNYENTFISFLLPFSSITYSLEK